MAKKRCDAMFMYYFIPLVLLSNTPASVIRDLYKDVKLQYLSPRAQTVNQLAFYLMKVSIPSAVFTLRTIYNVRNYAKQKSKI